MDINDEYIINYFVKSNGKLNACRCNIMNMNQEIKDYLDNRFEEKSRSYLEAISRIYHKIDSIPICKVCGNKLNFQKFNHPYGKWCGCKCQLRDRDFISNRSANTDYSKIRETHKKNCLAKYGVENYNNHEKFKKTCLERYGVESPLMLNKIRSKIKKTCLEKYGSENPSKLKFVTDKIKTTKKLRYGDENYVNKEKAEKTCFDKYGAKDYMSSEEFSKMRNSSYASNRRKEGIRNKYGADSYFETQEYKTRRIKHNIEKYGVEYYSQTDEFKNKVYSSKKKNHTFNSSRIEIELKKYLESKKVNFIYQYKSDKYPFSCDFYFPDYDLYFEIQGMWTHGGHPFNPDNNSDLKKLEMWKSKNTKFYENAIKVWTVSDVEKRKCAAVNGLNFEEIFSYKFDDVKLKINKLLNL